MPEPNAFSTSVVHIAGLDITVGQRLRQRCGWCGAVLIDDPVERIAVPEGQGQGSGIWPVGALVEVAGGNPRGFWIVGQSGDQLPDNACGALDPEVTA